MVKEDECLRSWHRCFAIFMYLSHPVCSRSVRKYVSTADRNYTTHRGRRCSVAVTADFQRHHNIPADITRPSGLPRIVVGFERRRWLWRKWDQKWGCYTYFFQQTTATERRSCWCQLHGQGWNLNLQTAGVVHVIAGNLKNKVKLYWPPLVKWNEMKCIWPLLFLIA